MKLSQLSLADYNQLDSIPVINQDLTASEFTPVANTYYRHTGTTTATFTQGVIYCYDGTGYVALDGSAVGLATVAKTGSYSDLQNIPTDIAKIGNLSNPNLLINPNFAINQRGETSYTGDLEYTVDRWKKSYGILELLTNGEIKHTSSNSWQGVAQYIENPSRLAGKTVTISAMGRGDGATAFRIYLYYQIGNNPRVTVCTAQTTSTTNTIISASGAIPEDITDNDKIYFMLYNSTANTSFYCKWAKLEVGSVATEFSPPSIAEELPKCQRYYQRYNFGNNMPLPLGIVRNEQTVSINFNIPKLRRNPTFATSGTVKLLNQNITGLTLTSNQYYDGVYRMFIKTSGLSAGTGILVAGDTDGYYAFDAEI